ncbi:MAG: helix-turn-helix transcriptional regulator [Cyanobacteria bacterium P01_A01_bin.123]
MPSDQKDQAETPPLKQIREALNLSQEKFARFIGCSAKKISRGENGGNVLWTMAEAKALDKFMQKEFGLTIHDLPDDMSQPIAKLTFLEKAG